MSSAVVSTSAALGRPFVFEDDAEPEVGSLQGSCAGSNRAKLDANNRPAAKILPSSVVPASHLSIRPAPEMVSSGISALDALTGGLPRGCLTEICGSPSSGRTSLLLAALAAATRRGEFCAIIDASDTLDPHSAAAAGVELEHLLWVRCNDDPPKKENSPQRPHVTEKQQKEKKEDGCPILAAPFAARVGTFSRTSSRANINRSERTNEWKENLPRQSEHRLEQVLRATDLLLESGGFGLIVLDLADLPTQAARRIPLTTWFRFRRAVENKPTILLAIEQHPIAGSCSSLLLQLGPANNESEASAQNSLFGIDEPAAKRRNKFNSHELDLPSHAHLLTGLDINTELIRSRLDRKPARSITFATKTAWAG
jgi:recombination protein RecA